MFGGISNMFEGRDWQDYVVPSAIAVGALGTVGGLGYLAWKHHQQSSMENRLKALHAGSPGYFVPSQWPSSLINNRNLEGVQPPPLDLGSPSPAISKADQKTVTIIWSVLDNSVLASLTSEIEGIIKASGNLVNVKYNNNQKALPDVLVWVVQAIPKNQVPIRQYQEAAKTFKEAPVETKIMVEMFYKVKPHTQKDRAKMIQFFDCDDVIPIVYPQDLEQNIEWRKKLAQAIQAEQPEFKDSKPYQGVSPEANVAASTRRRRRRRRQLSVVNAAVSRTRGLRRKRVVRMISKACGAHRSQRRRVDRRFFGRRSSRR